MRLEIIIFLITLSPAKLVQLPGPEKNDWSMRQEIEYETGIGMDYCILLSSFLPTSPAIAAAFCHNHLLI